MSRFTERRSDDAAGGGANRGPMVRDSCSRVHGTEYSERSTQWKAIAACASRRNQSAVQLLTCVVTMSTLHGPPPAAMRWMKTKQHKCCQLAAVDDGRADDVRGSGSRTRNLNNNVTARLIPDEKGAYITKRRQKWCFERRLPHITKTFARMQLQVRHTTRP